MGVVALRQVKGDDAVLVAGDDLPLTAGEQVERKADVAVAHLDRELQLIEPEDQPALGCLGNPVLPEPHCVTISWPGPCQRAAEAQPDCRRGIGDPVASAAVEVGADRVIGANSRHGALLARVPDRSAARDAHGVLEKELGTADLTVKGTHDRPTMPRPCRPRPPFWIPWLL